MDLLLASARDFREGSSAASSLTFDLVHHLLNAASFEAAVEARHGADGDSGYRRSARQRVMRPLRGDSSGAASR